VVREDLFYSDFDYAKCIDFYSKIKELPYSPTSQAYQAAAEALIAKYSWNPISKIQYLNSAKDLLTQAVSHDNKNIEIRFLRFYIENSLPAYLGKNQNGKEDKQVIIDNLENLKTMDLGTDIMNYIINYITSPTISSEEEIAVIKTKISSG